MPSTSYLELKVCRAKSIYSERHITFGEAYYAQDRCFEKHTMLRICSVKNMPTEAYKKNMKDEK